MTSVLQRLPALASTGVGSLPFQRPRPAARHAACAYELPFCPQLPRLYGDMIVEWLGADPGGCGWSPDRDRQLPGVWEAFVAALEASPPAHRIVKLQVTGPVTLAIALERGAGRGRGQADAVDLAAEIATWLAASAAGQTDALAELGFDVVLIIDEPGVATAGLVPGDVSVWDPLRRVGAAWGLHICGAVPWPLVDAAEPDVLSFDSLRQAPEDPAIAALTRLVSRGGRIMWGMVDPVDPSGARSVGLLAGAISMFGNALSPVEVLAASLLSPSCGTGRLSIESERRVAATVQGVADAMRAGVPDARAPAPTEPEPRAIANVSGVQASARRPFG